MIDRNEQLSIYSDLYKDARGFRPTKDMSDVTNEQLQTMIDEMQKEVNEVIEQEKEDAKQDIRYFEKVVAEKMEQTKQDRQTIINSMLEENFNDKEYLCYQFGLPFDYL